MKFYPLNQYLNNQFLMLKIPIKISASFTAKLQPQIIIWNAAKKRKQQKTKEREREREVEYPSLSVSDDPFVFC